MKIETKYNIGDKVWFSCENIKSIKSYIKEHPFEELQQILKSCFREGYVKTIDVEVDVDRNKPCISYFITTNKCCGNQCGYYGNGTQILERDIFSNFDEITNMIKETQKDVLKDILNKNKEMYKDVLKDVLKDILNCTKCFKVHD